MDGMALVHPVHGTRHGCPGHAALDAPRIQSCIQPADVEVGVRDCQVSP
jgi:hypothetical protein